MGVVTQARGDTMNTRTMSAAVAGALVVLLSGCSGGGSGPDGTGGPGEADATLGPLGEYYQKVLGEQDQESFDDQQRRAEEIVAACMAEEGFEYIPVENNGMVVQVGGDDGPAWDSVEFAEQFGYGATTYEDMPGYSSGEEYVDPNQDYVEAMSESERDAYYEALYGPPQEAPSDDATAEAVEWDWTTAGCQGKGQHESSVANQAMEDESFKVIMEELNHLYEGVADDPRLADIDSEWAACMSEAGYTFATPSEAQQSIYDAMNELWEQASADGANEPDEAAMAELRTTEIATAVADRTCQIEVKYTERQQAIYFEMEQRIVDAHRAELDAWAAKYGQDG